MVSANTQLPQIPLTRLDNADPELMEELLAVVERIARTAGFIGGQVVAQLRSRGDDVVGVDAMIPQAHGAHATTPPDVHRLDLRNAATWADLLDGVDVVCHQAAMVGAGVTPADLPSYAAHNDLGTATLLSAALSAAVSPLFLLMTAAIGLNQLLLVATGRCPASSVVDRLLARRTA